MNNCKKQLPVNIDIDLSDSMNSIESLIAFFEKNSNYFQGDTIVIAEGPPISADESNVSGKSILPILIEKSAYHCIHKSFFFAPTYFFCFSEQTKKANYLAHVWMLFDRVKIMTVKKCIIPSSLEQLSINYSLTEDSCFDSKNYVSICIKGEFDSDLHLRIY